MKFIYVIFHKPYGCLSQFTGEKGKKDIHYHKKGNTVNMKLGKVFDLKRMMDWFQVIYLYLYMN